MPASLAGAALFHRGIIGADLVPGSCDSKAQPGNISVSTSSLSGGLELRSLAAGARVFGLGNSQCT